MSAGPAARTPEPAHEQTDPRLTGARARAAGALREFGHALMAHDADVELLDEVADAAARVTERLRERPPRNRDLVELKRRMFDVEVADGQRVVHFDECFVSGPWNPMGIGIEVRRQGEEAIAEVELGPAFEGAPGRSHGGIVAALFDDVLGYLLTLRRTPGFTGELHVRYHAATPIGQRLRVRARVTSVEGRKLDTQGEAYALDDDGAEGDPVATATARFVTIPADRIRG